MEARNPYLFLVGCARSGTTLVRRMLDAHPRLAMTPESHWIPKFFRKRTGLTPEGHVTSSLVDRLFEYHRVPRLQVAREEIEQWVTSDERLTYAHFVSRLLDRFGQARDKQLVGDKTPDYVREIPLLHSLWPSSRFVHLIRDGRDVALSVLSWSKASKCAGRFPTWAEDPVTTAALWWMWNVRHGLQAGKELPRELYRELRYESVVSHPEEEVSGLCAFLGLPYDERMLRFYEGRTHLVSKHAWRPITPGHRNWRTQMPATEVERFEAVAGDLLDDLGYERVVPRVSDSAREHGERIAAQFTRYAQSRRWSLPAQW